MNSDYPNPGRLSLWILAALLLAGNVVGAGEVESVIFEDGTRWRGEEYVMARDMLVQRGPSLTPFLQQKTRSKDCRQRIFAEILICRIQRPQEVARWDKALAGLVNDRSVRQVLETYREPEWDKLPNKAADVPASHVVDVLWETADLNSLGRKSRRTAAALQFYFAPHLDAVEAAVQVLAVDDKLKYLAREGFVKLGAAAVPHMRQVLEQTVPPAVKDPRRMTIEERESRHAYWRQMRRAVVAVNVLARQHDADSVPLIVKCLKEGGSNSEYIKALSGALAELKAVAAIDVILDHLLRSAVARQRTGGNHKPRYDLLRSHVVSFGRDALPAVKRRLHDAEAESDRILLEYLVAELSGAKGKKEVAALRESLWFDETADGLLKLHRMTGEDVFPRLQALVRGQGPRRSQTDQRKTAMLTLSAMRDVRAVPLLADVLKDQHDKWQRAQKARTPSENAESFDPQVAREAADTFGWEDTCPADILDWGDTALLALRRIGSEDARKAVAAAVAYDEYKTRVETSLLLIDGRVDQLAARLDDKDRAVREEASLALLEIGDRRATRELLCAAARRQGAGHQQWKQWALSSKDFTAELRELLGSKDVRQRVLAEAMLLEAKTPDKAVWCSRSLQATAQGVGMVHVIRIGMIEAAGRGLVTKTAGERRGDPSCTGPPSQAQLLVRQSPFGRQVQPLDESYLPLVEAACLFDRGVILRGVAAFALAEWKKPRSMEVLAASFNMGSLHGFNPAALALADFGPEGAKLAAKVPSPKPGQHDTGLRMTRHRGGTCVLAEQKDIRGVDEIIKGLKVLEQDPKLNMWSHRAGIYLTAAGKFHDRRLVDPLLRILNVSEWPQRDVHATVINLLAAYDDPRLVPLFTQRMTSSVKERTVALMALTRRLGEKTPDYLIEQFKASGDDGFRGVVLLGLGELSYPGSPPYPGKAGWSPKAFEAPDGRNEAAAKTREMAYSVLVEALDDPSSRVNAMAASGLTILAEGKGLVRPNLRAVEPLTHWCRKRKTCPYPLTEYLAKHGSAETGRVLLEVLETKPPERGYPHLAGAVGMLKPPGAVAVLARNVRAHVATHQDRYGAPPELTILAEFGPPGAEALLAIFRDVDQMPCRLNAAHLLAQKECKTAAGPIAELLRRTIKAGPANAKLVALDHESRKRAYVRTCASLIESLRRLAPQQAKQIAEGVIRDGPDSLHAACLKVWAGE